MPHAGVSESTWSRRLAGLLDRVRVGLAPPTVPDHGDAPGDGRSGFLWRLERTRALLEAARTVIAQDGFTTGAWFTVPAGAGVRTVTGPEAVVWRRTAGSVATSCLVGTLLRLADDPDRPGDLSDAWHGVDELYEALHDRLGHWSAPTGRISAPVERLGRVQVLTAWNDAPGRTRSDVVDLIDVAIARTIVGSCLG